MTSIARVVPGARTMLDPNPVGDRDLGNQVLVTLHARRALGHSRRDGHAPPKQCSRVHPRELSCLGLDDSPRSAAEVALVAGNARVTPGVQCACLGRVATCAHRWGRGDDGRRNQEHSDKEEAGDDSVPARHPSASRWCALRVLHVISAVRDYGLRGVLPDRRACASAYRRTRNAAVGQERIHPLPTRQQFDATCGCPCGLHLRKVAAPRQEGRHLRSDSV